MLNLTGAELPQAKNILHLRRQGHFCHVHLTSLRRPLILGRLCVYGIYKRPLRAPTNENTLVLIAVDIGGKNTQE